MKNTEYPFIHCLNSLPLPLSAVEMSVLISGALGCI